MSAHVGGIDGRPQPAQAGSLVETLRRIPRVSPEPGLANANECWSRLVLAGLLAVLLACCLAGRARAEEEPVPSWESTGLTEPAGQLFTPASGAFFATVKDGLMRSDDGGATWRAINVPPKLGRVAVDPTNHTVIYAAGEGGLYKTGDDAATWQLIMPTPWNVAALAVSPADPNLIQLAIKDQPTNATLFRRLRSRDGGATWEQLQNTQASLCGWGVSLLKPHPTDPRRVFIAYDCFAGRTMTVPLEQSLDQAATWTPVFKQSFWQATLMDGGRGAMPTRYYLAAQRDFRMGGFGLFRSEDDGATWSETMTTPRSLNERGQQVAPNARVEALVYDPVVPDRVYLAVHESDGPWWDSKTAHTYRVLGSADAGGAWLELSGPDFPKIDDLALGIDGRNLYAATERGVLRLPFPG